jgi:hypothetical protein
MHICGSFKGNSNEQFLFCFSRRNWQENEADMKVKQLTVEVTGTVKQFSTLKLF